MTSIKPERASHREALDGALQQAMRSARERYIAEHPASAAAYGRATRSFPGGNTRTVLHFDPFPLTLARGVGSDVWDLDGLAYADFVGEFSAGLFGHSDPTIRAAIVGALDSGLVMGAPGEREVALAELIRRRFPSIESLRFCNSGTEANLLALSSAVALTGRRKLLVFEGAYHGGVLAFSNPPSALNVPWDFVLVPYNDTERACRAIAEMGDSLAAVMVEPILGAGGNIPGSPEFLHALRKATRDVGALLIFDEVKTSRCGAGGLQGRLGIRPDLTTLGKYLGGGLPCGVLGGAREWMAQFAPGTPRALRHAGTFNNNACTMAAGLAALGEVFTAERAEAFDSECESMRVRLNASLAETGLPMRCSGLGSMFSVHFMGTEPARPADIPPSSARLVALFHLEALLEGVLIANRGDIFVSLTVEERHQNALRRALLGFAHRHASLIEGLTLRE